MTYSEWRATAQYFDYAGKKIAYYTSGDSGPVLTFIHGFPTSSHDWSKAWALLKKGYRLIALDLLGFGGSDKPRPYDYKIAEQALIVEQLWSVLGLTSSSIIAHDYGSSVALELIALRREGEREVQLDNCFLLNGGIIPHAYQPRPVQRLMASPIGPITGLFLGRSTLASNFRAIFGPGYELTKDELDQFWASIREKNGKWAIPYIGRYLHERKQQSSRWLESLQYPGIPMYYFWGAFDPISGSRILAAMWKLQSSIGGESFTEVGHYPQWEKPEELAELIKKTIKI